MVLRKPASSRNVPHDPQIEWNFDVDSQFEDKQEAPSIHAAVRFREPDPKGIFVTNQRLDRFLEEMELGDTVKIGELLSALDCWDAFAAAYKPGGRSPHHPRLLVGLILLALMEGRTSLREMELLGRADVRGWWLSGGLCPDHSTLGKFINRHKDLLTGEFFEILTAKVVEATGGHSSRLSADGTVIEAVASRASLVRQEAAEQAAAEATAAATAAPDDQKLARKAELAEQVAETSRQRSEERKKAARKNQDAPVSSTEPESVVQQQKNKTFRPSYKPSIATNEQRVILGQDVDPTNEARVVQPMLEQAERITGEQAQELLVDAGYFTSLVIMLCFTADISLLCPQGKREGNEAKPKTSKKRFLKNQFRYDEEHDEYICPADQRLQPRARCAPDGPGKLPYVKYICKQCDGCSLRAKCTNSSNGRTIKRYEGDELLDAQMCVMQHPQAQKLYGKRQGMVEPVFAELRYIQGLVRFRRRGLPQVKMEFALHAAAHNVRRYLRLTVRVSEEGAAGGDGAEAAIATIFVLTALQTLLSAGLDHSFRFVTVSRRGHW